MFPHRLLILAILRVAIFSIEVPERERELSEEQYAMEAAAEVAYCFELYSLSLSLSGTEVLKMAAQRTARIQTTGGEFHFTFLFTGLDFFFT